MLETIVPLMQCCETVMPATAHRQLMRIVSAMLAMTGRVTMRGIARWTAAGGSYRTIQRFYQTTLPWLQLHWILFHTHHYQAETVYLMAGDGTIVTKAGSHTHGLDRVYSSLVDRPIAGLAFFVFALVSVHDHRAYPLLIEQIVRTPDEKAASAAKTAARKAAKTKATTPPRPRGRPKGSKNRTTADRVIGPSGEILRIGGMLQRVKQRIMRHMRVTYVLLDGQFGHAQALAMVQAQQYHLISRLRSDSALWYPPTPTAGKRGRPPIYGKRVIPTAIPHTYRVQTSTAHGVTTELFQLQVRHRQFPALLNCVIIGKTNLSSGKHAWVILFSDDLTLTAATLQTYYGLRFQIEFVFRDAKQYWGLEDFMNIKEISVDTAANLSMLMVTIATALLPAGAADDPATTSVLDVKATYRGLKYVHEALKMLPEKPDPLLIQRIEDLVCRLGRIHAQRGPVSRV